MQDIYKLYTLFNVTHKFNVSIRILILQKNSLSRKGRGVFNTTIPGFVTEISYTYFAGKLVRLCVQ